MPRWPHRSGVGARPRCALLAAVVACGACGSFGAADGSDADAGGEAGAGGDAGAAGAGEDAPGKASCNEVHLAAKDKPSGLYRVHPATAGANGLLVYCDMTSADGGWTLVARSVAKSAAAFGWKIAVGDVEHDEDAYAVDARKLAPFTEILFAARDDGKGVADPAYRRTLPSAFLDGFGDKLAPIAGSIAVRGACKADGTNQDPTMLSRVGDTDAKDHFVFTDQEATPAFGLGPDGWDTNQQAATPDCRYDGALTGKQGLIFVR